MELGFFLSELNNFPSRTPVLSIFVWVRGNIVANQSVKMKLKQLEGFLGDLQQFSNPKVSLLFLSLSMYIQLLSYSKLCSDFHDAGWTWTIPNWSSYCLSHALHCISSLSYLFLNFFCNFNNQHFFNTFTALLYLCFNFFKWWFWASMTCKFMLF